MTLIAFTRRPTEDEVRRHLREQEASGLSYPEEGASRHWPPPGYHHDHFRARLGAGRDVYEAARNMLRSWEQFRTDWTSVVPHGMPLEPGRSVAVVARSMGAWTVNPGRVVYLDESEGGGRVTFAFGFGTLPAHAESGEERFAVEWCRADDSVWYDVRAFFRPRHVLARLAWPVLRRTVDRFRRDSAGVMRRGTAGVGHS